MLNHRLSAKPLNATMSALLKRAAHVGLGVGAFTPILALANPTGGQVTAGQATIATPNSNKTVIDQTSQSAIINWQSFSIGSGQYVQFLQPSSSSVVLNRVVGGNASSILGNLSANGQVFLINPNGIFFGKSANIDVQGLLASTLNISDSNFLSGNYVFDKGTGAPDASVVNQGRIQSGANGYVVLAGDYAANAGIISGQMGHVVLASGTQATLSLSGNSLVNFAVDQATLAKLAGVANSGSLLDDGGTVIMTADVANALKATVVNNTGLIEARGINNQSGAIYLTAEGGNLFNSGTLDADAKTQGGVGGDIVLQGNGATQLTSTSKLTAAGMNANGGTLEISGQNISVRGTADVGQAGNLLLDPNKVKLVTGSGHAGTHGGTGTGASGTVGVGFIQTALDAGGNVKISAHSAISHSVAATAITAVTGTNPGAGALNFQIASGGQINLKGLNINIAGTLNASAAAGGNANMSFGQITAKNATIKAGTGVVDFVNGTGTVPSVKGTGGAITIDAGNIAIESGALLFIQDVGGAINIAANIGSGEIAFNGAVALNGKSVVDTGIIHNTGNRNINVTASNGNMSVGQITANSAGNVTLTDTGGRILDLNTVTAGGKLTLTDNTGNVNVTRMVAGNGIAVTDQGNFHVSSGTANGGSFVVNGVGNVNVTKHVSAQKNVNITATTGTVKTGAINAYGGAVTVTDTAANMTVGSVHAASNVVLNNLGHTLSFASNGGVHAGHNVALVATTIQQTGTNFDVSAAGTINVKGQITLGADISGGHNLTLNGAGGVKLDHGVAIPGAVTIVGPSLTYAGTSKTFSLSAADGNLTLDAAIGSAAALAAYNVNLLDQGDAIFIQKSIYVGNTASHLAANITATETGHVAGPGLSGVLVGNSYGGAVTLSAPGNVRLTGWNVGVGDVGAPGIGHNFGSINVLAGGGLVFTATGSLNGYGGNVDVKSAKAETSNGTKNTSILLQAGTGMKLVGDRVDVEAGIASASIGDNALGQAMANVTLKAVNIALTGGNSSEGSVHVSADGAVAKGFAGNNQTNKATANANVMITATGNITLTGEQVSVSGGYGGLRAQASAGEGEANMTAIANAQVIMSATNTIAINGGATGYGEVRVEGGFRAGASNEAFAEGGNETATAVTHGDTKLTAGNAINISANNVYLAAGSVAGLEASSHDAAAAFDGSNAKATDTTTSNLNLTAGAGGINVTAGQTVKVEGGNWVFSDAKTSAGYGGTATVTGTAQVNLTATGGNVNITAGNGVDIQAGYGVANRTQTMGYGGTATLTADGSVNITAVNVAMTTNHASYGVAIFGGEALQNARVYAESGSANATVTGTARTNITATGNLTLTGKHSVTVAAGSADHQGVASGAQGSGYGGGHASLTADGGVGLTATNITLGSLGNSASQASVEIKGGDNALANAGAIGEQGASVHLTGNAETSIVATGGNLTVNGANNIFISGGNGAIHNVGKNSTGAYSFASTEIAGHAGVQLEATGTMSLNASNGGPGGGNLHIQGGASAARAVTVTTNHGGFASVTGLSSVTIDAGGSFSAKAKLMEISGGSRVASNVHASAYGSGNGGFAGAFGNASVSITAPSISLHATGSLNVHGGNKAGYGDTAYASGGANVQTIGFSSVGIDANAGDLTITAFDGLKIEAGSGAAAFAHEQGYGGFTGVFAGNGVDLTGNNVTLSSGGGHGGYGIIAGGYRAGAGANLFASNNGNNAQASVDGYGFVSINAGNGNLSIVESNLNIRGGSAAAGYGSVRVANGARAGAGGSAGVNLSAPGTIVLDATQGGEQGPISISGGRVAGGFGHASAEGAGSAQIRGLSSVSINAGGSFSAKGDDIQIHAGSQAAHDAQGSGYGYSAHTNVDITGNGSVRINAASVLLQAIDSISINGGNSAARSDFAYADGYGTAITGTARVDITANTGNISVLANNRLDISAGDHAGQSGNAQGYGANFSSGHATISGDAGVSLTAANITIGSTGHALGSVHLRGGEQAGAFGFEYANRGAASITGNAVVSLDATTGNLAVSGKNAIAITAGTEAAGYGSGDNKAYSDGNIAVNGNAGVNLTAHGNVTLTGGEIQIEGGKNAAAGNHFKASYGVATVSGLSSVNITAGGSFTAIGNGAISLNAGYGAARSLDAIASYGGKATLTGNASVIVNAANITLQGPEVLVLAASSAGKSADLSERHGGTASVSAISRTNLTATGNAKLRASNAVFVFGGNNAGESADAFASSGGKAILNVNETANIKGAVMSLTATTGEVFVSGGNNAAAVGEAEAFDSANALLNVKSGVTLNATAGNLVLNGMYGVLVRGGNNAAAGRSFTASFNSNSHSTASGFAYTHRHIFETSYTQAKADYGTLATAKVAANAGVSLTDTGGILAVAAASGGIALAGGSKAAALANVQAGYGATATVSGISNLTVSAPTVKLTAKGVEIIGGSHDLKGAFNSTDSFFVHTNHNNGYSTNGPTAHSSSAALQDSGKFDAKAVKSADSSVTVNTGTLTIAGGSYGVLIGGGYGAGNHLNGRASYGGLLSYSAKQGVALTATTAFTATAKGGELIIGHSAERGSAHAGGSAGGYGAISATGFGAKAVFNGTGQVSITAPTAGLTAGREILITGGSDAANGLNIQAHNGGSANVTLNDGVSITANTAFTAALSGNSNGTGFSNHGIGIFINAARFNAGGANVGGYGSSAKANLNINGDTDIVVTQAGGTLTIAGNNQAGDILVNGGSANAMNAHVGAFSGGAATLTESETTNLTALGAISLSAKGNVFLENQDSLIGYGAGVIGVNGGTAKLSLTDNLNVTGGTVTLTATSYAQNTTSGGTTHRGGNIGIDTNYNRFSSSASALLNASRMNASGYGGSGAATVNSQVNIKATGALTLTAPQDIVIGGGSRGHSSARSNSAYASGQGAVAALTWNGGANLTAANVTMTAGDNITITAPNGGDFAEANAYFKGNATNTAVSRVNITASSAFTAVAGNEFSMFGAQSEAGYGRAFADHPGAQANFFANGTVNVNAKSIALSAGRFIDVEGGYGVGTFLSGSAEGNGKVAIAARSGVNLTAANALSLKLTGSGGYGSIDISAAGNVGRIAHASGYGGGQTTLNVNGDVNLNVTGATGTLTVDTGALSSGHIAIRPGFTVGGDTPCGCGPSAGIAAVAEGQGAKATLNLSANVNLTAKGALTLHAGSDISIGRHSPNFGGGPSVSFQENGTRARASASYGGKATLSLSDATKLSGGTVTMTAGDNISITAASGTFNSAQVTAKTGGSASMAAQAGVTLAATGAFTLTAGYGVEIFAGGTAEHYPLAFGDDAGDAIVFAKADGAHANLAINGGLQLTAASVAMTAVSGSMFIEAGNDTGYGIGVSAVFAGDKATASLTRNVSIVAPGKVSLTAGYGLFMDGGEDIGPGNHVFAGASPFGPPEGSFATATDTVTGGVTITAGKAFTVTAASVLIEAGSGGLNGRTGVVAFGPGTVAQATLTTGVNLTASSMAITAKDGNIALDGANFALQGISAAGVEGGQATVTGNGAVSLSATGNVSLKASNGGIFIQAGGGYGVQQGISAGGFGGTLNLSNNESVAVTAGGNLTLNAATNIDVSGGYGVFGAVNAFEAGSANMTLNNGVTLSAAKAMSITAGGDLWITAGSDEALIANALFSDNGSSLPPGGGTVKGTLTTAVNLAGGSNVTLAAGGNVTIAAAQGDILTVGGPLLRSSSGSPIQGHTWNGGRANLAANVGATVSAVKNLTITTGTAGNGGSLQVLGLRPDRTSFSESNNHIFLQNQAMVHGGSETASATVNLNGNTLLTAGSNLTLNVAGNASIVGGAPNIVLALHTEGNANVTGSANATLHAGKNVVLNNIAGSLTLAANNAGPSGGEMEVDTHADSGSAVAIGHADAAITAGGSITTVTALGGGLNLIGGSFVEAIAHGSAQNQRVTATANASLVAGTAGNVNITATGGLNILAGRFGKASASIEGPFFEQSHTAVLSATANITAGNTARVVVGGNAVIAGGDSITANGHASAISVNFADATANVGAGIQGAAVSLGVHGNLLVRGGFGNHAKTFVGGTDSGNIASASVNAAVGITAKTGNIGINVGGSSAMIRGGSEGVASVTNFFTDNVGNANVHSDVTLSAGGNVGIAAAGNLTVAGGAANQQFAELLAGGPSSFFGSSIVDHFAKITAANTSAVKVTAGGSITVNQTGGNLNLLGGSDDAFFNFILGGPGGRNTIKETVDSSVLMKAGTTLTFNGANNVTVANGTLPDGGTSGVGSRAGTGPFIFNSGSNFKLGLTINSSVKLMGTTVTVNHTGGLTVQSSGSFTSPSGGIKLMGGVFGLPAAGVHGGLSSHGAKLSFTPEAQVLDVAPATSETSFGGVKPLSSLPVSTVQAPAAQTVVTKTDGGLSVEAALQPLATLQSGSLVLSLVPAVGKADVTAAPEAVTLFTPVAGSKSYSDSFSGACVALVVSRDGADCTSK